jgi:hypothetical protein
MAVRTPFNRRRSGNAKSAEKRQQDVRPGDTRASSDPDSVPRPPHERDESADSQNSSPRAEIEQASRDLKRGLQDTSRSPEADSTYRKPKNGGA